MGPLHKQDDHEQTACLYDLYISKITTDSLHEHFEQFEHYIPIYMEAQ